MSREAELSALRRAIAVERRARYADFQGRRSTFSQFMRQTSERMARRHPLETIWVTIRALFRQYPNVDVATRISIVRRAEELLIPLWDAVEAAADSSSPPRENTLDPGGDAKASFCAGKPIAADAKLRDALAPPAAKSAANLPGRSSAEASKPQQPGNSSPTGKAHGLALPAVPSPRADAMQGKPLANAPVNGNASPTHKSTSAKFSDHRVQNDNTAKAKSSANDPDEVNVQFVKGVGPKMAAVLGRLGISTVGDLLRHYPRRHLDFQNRLFIRDVRPGQEVTVFATIRTVSAFQSKRGNVSVINILLSDGTGSLMVTRFIGGKSNKYLLDRYKEQFPKGATVIASGLVERDKFAGKNSLRNAELEVLGFLGGDSGQHEAESQKSIHTGRLVPVYPLTEGVSLRYLRNVIYNALEAYGGSLTDPLPQSIREAHQLMDLRDALMHMHFPDDPLMKESARRRLVFDELFGIQLELARRRHKFDQTEGALSLEKVEGGLVDRLIASLPFQLTAAQRRVFAEIARDLAAPKPMHRLVQGDVGSGKTVVALMACLMAIDNGYQAVVMAPTEILAEQHYFQFQRLLTPLGLKAALVVGKQGQKERRQTRQDLFSGQVHVAVGTHALLEEDVEFKNLGLIIIDEQHRFGVKQRARLKAKSLSPELLTMTATPIPRTLALTMHGDLDVSEIDELPPGRKPVETRLLKPGDKRQIWAFIKEQVMKGRQAYIVFPLIEESETLSAKAATQEFEKLRTTVFSELRVGLMHGKLKAQEKEEVMERFRRGDFQVLVSTTVIEVGVDVPNASVMVIENADRFGLAQLHQLRGRVGRGAEQSYCFLIADCKSEQTRQRLEIMTQTNDGFVVAERDLEIRGPGEFLGYRQSGLPDMILTDLVQDTKILEEARKAAINLIKRDPELSTCPALKKTLARKTTVVEPEIIRSG
ncbi:MAG TPA: ATP-dependent DNA helicase RecG [Candidatus Obscuribacterales bacterium]